MNPRWKHCTVSTMSKTHWQILSKLRPGLESFRSPWSDRKLLRVLNWGKGFSELLPHRIKISFIYSHPETHTSKVASAGIHNQQLKTNFWPSLRNCKSCGNWYLGWDIKVSITTTTSEFTWLVFPFLYSFCLCFVLLKKKNPCLLELLKVVACFAQFNQICNTLHK